MSRTVPILLSLLLVAIARAQSVDFEQRDYTGWVGTPLTMVVQLNDLPDDVEPTVIGTPADFAVQVIAAGSSQSTRVINGRVSRSSTRSFRVEFTPKVPGTLDMPEVEVRSGGKRWSSKPGKATVTARDDASLLRIEARANPTRPWVGQPTEVTLRILLRPLDTPQARNAVGTGLLWKILDAQRCQFGAFTETLVSLSRGRMLPEGREEVIDGAAWLVYEIDAQVTPDMPGPVALGELLIVVNYPFGLRANQDFFGDTQFVATRQRPAEASLRGTVAEAIALPDQGRPASFRGAVGRFSVDASAKPTQVAAGDPITLTVNVTTLGTDAEQLRMLQPPPIDATTLGPVFRVPTDPLAGTVRGSVKSFTQTVRPTSPEVKAIPPVEFSFFDPQRGAYETVRTKAIPISVSPSERVGSDRIERSGGATDKPATATTEVAGGMLANAAPTPDLLRDGRVRLGVVAAVAVTLPPVFAAAALLIRRRRDRLLGDAGLVRAQGALRSARMALATASDQPAISAAILGFVADRTNHAPGTVTRSQAVRLATEAGADTGLATRLDRLLAAGERAAFAPERGGPVDAARDEADAMLSTLDRLAWRRRQAASLEVTA
jgi:hypothetical protein